MLRYVCVHVSFLGVQQRVNTADVFLFLLHRLGFERRDRFVVAIARRTLPIGFPSLHSMCLFTPCMFEWFGYLRYTLFAVVIAVLMCVCACVRACMCESRCATMCVYCARIQTQFDASACYSNTNRGASIKTKKPHENYWIFWYFPSFAIKFHIPGGHRRFILRGSINQLVSCFGMSFIMFFFIYFHRPTANHKNIAKQFRTTVEGDFEACHKISYAGKFRSQNNVFVCFWGRLSGNDNQIHLSWSLDVKNSTNKISLLQRSTGMSSTSTQSSSTPTRTGIKVSTQQMVNDDF